MPPLPPTVLSATVRVSRRMRFHVATGLTHATHWLMDQHPADAFPPADLKVVGDALTVASNTASRVAILSDLYIRVCDKYPWLPFARVLGRRVPAVAYRVAYACSVLASCVIYPKPAWATFVLTGALLIGQCLADASL